MAETYTAITLDKSARWVKLKAEQYPGVQCEVIPLDTVEAVHRVGRLIGKELLVSDHGLPTTDEEIAPYIDNVVADGLNALNSGNPTDAYRLSTEGDPGIFQRIIAQALR